MHQTCKETDVSMHTLLFGLLLVTLGLLGISFWMWYQLRALRTVITEEIRPGVNVLMRSIAGRSPVSLEDALQAKQFDECMVTLLVDFSKLLASDQGWSGQWSETDLLHKEL